MGIRDTMLLRSSRRGRRRLAPVLLLVAAATASLRSVVGSLLRLSIAVIIGTVDDDVAHATALCILARQGLIFVVGIGELGNDVPGVDQAGEVAENEEEDVDDGVGAADAALDPDW